jgi:hypothetical protein
VYKGSEDLGYSFLHAAYFNLALALAQEPMKQWIHEIAASDSFENERPQGLKDVMHPNETAPETASNPWNFAGA